MNNYESIVRAWEDQVDPALMTPEKQERIDLAISKSQELYDLHRSLWKSNSSTGEEFDYSPEIKVENIEALTNEDWLESRKEGIGGSEAGAILGLNKYANQHSLALEKLSVKPLPEKTPESQYTLDFGHAMEPVILKLYEAKSGNVVFTDRHQYRHPKHPFMLADCDGFAITPEGEPILLELKSFNYNLRDAWIPGTYGKGGAVKNPEYICQVRHYLSVLNLNRADIIAQCGNMASDMIVVTVYRDIPFEENMIREEDIFWRRVMNYDIPEIVTFNDHIYERIRDVMYNEASNDPDEKVTLVGDEIRANIESLQEIDREKTELKERLKILETKEKELRLPILDQLGKAKTGEFVVDDTKKFIVTNKPIVKESIDADKLSLGYPDIYESVKKTTLTAPVFRMKEWIKKKK